MTDTTDGTAQATDSQGGLTEDQAAERFAQMLSDDGDSEGGTEEAEASATEPDDDGDEPEAEGSEESDQPDDADDSQEAPQSFTVKIDGEEQTVTLDELTRGYSRQADYTRKTMALAEERKTLDAEKAALAPERDAYREALNRLEAFFNAAEDDSAQLAQLRHTDPAEYAARVAEKQQRATQLAALKAEQARLDAQKAHETARHRADTVREEEAKLLKRIPEWSDKAKRETEQGQIVDYALNHLGLAPDEVNEIYDHRLVEALRDAAKWRALQARKPAVQAKVDAVKPAKPGSTPQQRSRVTTDLTRSRQRLAKTGREADAAAVFLQMLPD